MILERFQEHLKQLGLSGKKLLVALSGGLDSTVLVHLLESADIKPGLVHANFQLRGAESDMDEEWVRKQASEYGLPVWVKRFETNNHAIERGISIQMAARELRYAWFSNVLKEQGFDWIVTAHHLNDSLETSLHNFVRGTGLTGLVGIPLRHQRVARPLLIFKRSELEKYAKTHALIWREDASNATDDYHRNFIRHQVIPKFRELNPALEDTFSRTLMRLSAAHELASLGMQMLREKFVTTTPTAMVIRKELLTSVTNSAGVLSELIKELGFNFHQCQDIVEAAKGQPGKSFSVPGFRLFIDRTAIMISPAVSAAEPTLVREDQETAALGSWRMDIERIDSPKIGHDHLMAALDSSRLIFPLVWRNWKAGDYFRPLGMDRQKKISDFLIDSKVPAGDKERVTVVESNGEIAWVVGMRIDDRFKVRPETRSVVMLKVAHE